MQVEWKVCGDWTVIGTVEDDTITLNKRGVFVVGRYPAKLPSGCAIDADGKLQMTGAWAKRADWRTPEAKKKASKKAAKS